MAEHDLNLAETKSVETTLKENGDKSDHPTFKATMVEKSKKTDVLLVIGRCKFYLFSPGIFIYFYF
jgi:hypothetical protein